MRWLRFGGRNPWSWSSVAIRDRLFGARVAPSTIWPPPTMTWQNSTWCTLKRRIPPTAFGPSLFSARMQSTNPSLFSSARRWPRNALLVYSSNCLASWIPWTTQWGRHTTLCQTESLSLIRRVRLRCGRIGAHGNSDPVWMKQPTGWPLSSQIERSNRVSKHDEE